MIVSYALVKGGAVFFDERGWSVCEMSDVRNDEQAQALLEELNYEFGRD